MVDCGSVGPADLDLHRPGFGDAEVSDRRPLGDKRVARSEVTALHMAALAHDSHNCFRRWNTVFIEWSNHEPVTDLKVVAIQHESVAMDVGDQIEVAVMIEIDGAEASPFL